MSNTHLTSNKLSIDITKQIPFYDVDSYQIVWHGHYAKYFEEARCALLEKIGCTYEDMKEWGYFFPVIDLSVRYVKPLLFKQNIRINAVIKQWQNKLVVDYLISDIDSSERLTKGSTTQVAISIPDYITQYDSPAPLIDKINELINEK